MKCSDRNIDILMFAHGEATLIAKLKVFAHVVGCKSCRTHLKEYRSLSVGLANTLRNPTLGTKKIRRWTRLEILGGVALFLVLLGSAIAFRSDDTPKVEVCEPTSVKAVAQPSKEPIKIDSKIVGGPNFIAKSCD